MTASIPSAPALVVTESALPALSDLARLWRDLEERAEASFFLSWTWIGAWLATLEESGYPTSALHLIAARQNDRVVGLAVIGVPEHGGGFRPKRAFLNQSGAPAHTDMYIEYNDVLTDASAAAEIRTACLGFLRSRWPQHRLQVQAAVEGLQAAMTGSTYAWRAQRTDICAYANLSAASPGDDALRQFLDLLSGNTRQQIARARRRAEQVGALTLSRAQSPAETESSLAELVALHSAAWHERKQRAGAFANPAVKRFVERLARDGFATGTVELLRICAGTQTIGVLLNFVFRGEAYSYQSGFAYNADNRDKPGLLCHALAAADYIGRGVRAYHFMAGESRYKKSLSNATEVLTWIGTYPSETIARAEHIARAVWHKIRALRFTPDAS